MPKTYDVALVLGGEDKNPQSPWYRNRSNKALELFRSGVVGNIFLTGGQGAFFTKPFGLPEAEEMKEYVLENHVPEKRIFTDERSYDTLGNISFPTADPKPGNPRLSDLSLILVTEEMHMPRAARYAEKVLKREKFDCEGSHGDHVPGMVTNLYNKGLLHALRCIKEASPEQVREFLLTRHPFYQEGWFDKSVNRRKIETLATILSWLLR